MLINLFKNKLFVAGILRFDTLKYTYVMIHKLNLCEIEADL